MSSDIVRMRRLEQAPPTRLAASVAVLAAVLLAGCDRQPSGPAIAPIEPTQPAALQTPPPVYPPELACYEQGGTVGLILKIGRDGTPRNIRIERNSGHAQLDQAALEAVKTWKFRPGTRGGQPVESDLRVPVTFTPPVERPSMCFQLDEQR